jgi:hypothetical protein
MADTDTVKREESIWISEHQEELESYSGKWIAVLQDKVIASGDSVPEVMVKAARESSEPPLVIKMPSKHEDLYVL